MSGKSDTDFPRLHRGLVLAKLLKSFHRQVATIEQSECEVFIQRRDEIRTSAHVQRALLGCAGFCSRWQLPPLVLASFRVHDRSLYRLRSTSPRRTTKRLSVPSAKRREPVRTPQDSRRHLDAPNELHCRKVHELSAHDERLHPPWPEGQPRK